MGEKEKLLHMEKILSERVVGQPEAVTAVRYESFCTINSLPSSHFYFTKAML